MKKTLSVAVLVFCGLLSITGCTKKPQQAQMPELATLVPSDIPMFIYADLHEINADAIFTKAFKNNNEDFNYEEFKAKGFDPDGKVGMIMLDIPLNPQDAKTVPTFAIFIPSTSCEDLLKYIIEKSEEDGEATITKDGEYTVIEDGEDIVYLTVYQGYVVIGMGEKVKDLMKSVNETRPENSLATSPNFKESFESVGMSSPALYAFIGGNFYEVLEKSLKENADTQDEIASAFMDMPDIEYAVVGGAIEQKRIILKSFAKYGEDISDHPMVAMYLADLPSGVSGLSEIKGDLTLYMRLVMNFMVLKEMISPYMDDQIDFSQFGMTEDEFWGMLRGDIQLMIGNLNMAAPEAGGIVGINNKETLIKIMTIATAAAGGSLTGQKDSYTFTQGNNKVDIKINANEVVVLMNAQSFSADGITLKEKLEEAGIENPDQYPVIIYIDAQKILPMMRMFAPEVGNKLSFMGTIASASKVEDMTSTGIFIINGSGENILEDIISSF
ncbi:hypothetical protein JW890_08660 [candidate division WOR-3 bacterium]|nr:hypothetical protein [candidate division WOR-3 bacterium]